MAETNPATPANAATPGSSESGTPNPSATTTPPTGQGASSEGKVTITNEQFAQLQRDSARLKSFQKRSAFAVSKNNPAGNSEEGANADPEKEELRRQNFELGQRALKTEVTLRVRDILEDPKYAALPASTKALIMKNPAALSGADNVEEALLDIEDFVNEQVTALASSGTGVPAGGDNSRKVDPTHETPPTGASANRADPGDMEDISKLTGSAKSRAMIRNAAKKARGGAV